MNERSASVVSRRWVLLAFLVVAGPASAQTDFLIPPSLLMPNYDRVYPGLTESLEGGAMVARARQAPALFYNPAGIATVDRTVLNASAQGYQLTTLGGSGFDHTSPVSSFEALPGFLGVVLGREVIDWESVRLGFAVAQPVHWAASANAGTAPDPGQRVNYSVKSDIDTLVPTFSIGWAASPTIRLGGSLEFPYTTISNTGALSGEITTATTSQGTLRTISAGGSSLQLRAVFGAQWDLASWMSLGATFRTPGLKIKDGGSFQYQGLTNLNTGTRQIFFQDPSANFEYRLPLEAALGAAFKFGPFAFEVDVRFHDGTHSYELFTSQQMARVTDTRTGTPVVTQIAFPGVTYRAKQVWNGNAGVHVDLSKTFSISAGAYLDYSPVDLPNSGFRSVNLIGFRTGVSFVIGKLTASVGLGWEHGTGNDDLFPSGVPIPGETATLSLNTFSLLFSVSFGF
jgi:hypothetical protein